MFAFKMYTFKVCKVSPIYNFYLCFSMYVSVLFFANFVNFISMLGKYDTSSTVQFNNVISCTLFWNKSEYERKSQTL